MNIRTARPDDAALILAINAASQPHVAPLDETELARLMRLASVFLVVAAPEVVAYFIAMRSLDDYDGEEFAHFRTTLAEPFLYIDQIAIEPPARSRGLGRELYAHAERWCREHEVQQLCCEVNLAPPNPRSMTFHDRVGFHRTGEIRTRDGRHVALLARKL